MRANATPRGEGGARRILDSDEWLVVRRELGLSSREREIVELLMFDVKESAIGARLGISPHTVHTHLERLYHKLGVRGRLQVVVRVLGACLTRLRHDAGTTPPTVSESSPSPE